jgi:hypothetical protein
MLGASGVQVTMCWVMKADVGVFPDVLLQPAEAGARLSGTATASLSGGQEQASSGCGLGAATGDELWVRLAGHDHFHVVGLHNTHVVSKCRG